MSDSSPPGTTFLLFAYGSLKRGQRHHHELAAGRFLVEARTAPRFALRLLEGYPLLVPGKSAVQGELFELPLTSLGSLDEFEGEAYERREIELEGGRSAIAYLARDVSSGAPYAGRDWRGPG
ncbi:MAG: gamma-glutamylcyclotransferase family protein [Pseudomonadota bacterium]